MHDIELLKLENKLKSTMEFLSGVEDSEIQREILKFMIKKSSFSNTKPYSEKFRISWTTNFLNKFTIDQSDFLFEQCKESFDEFFTNPRKLLSSFTKMNKTKNITLKKFDKPFFAKGLNITLGDTNNSNYFKGRASGKEKELLSQTEAADDPDDVHKKRSPIFGKHKLKNMSENLLREIFKMMFSCVIRSKILISNLSGFFEQDLKSIVSLCLRVKLGKLGGEEPSNELDKMEKLIKDFRKIYDKRPEGDLESVNGVSSELRGRLQSVESAIRKKKLLVNSDKKDFIKKIVAPKLRKIKKAKTSKVRRMPNLKNFKSPKSKKSKTSKDSSKKIPIKAVKNLFKKNNKPKKFDKFENFLIDYNSIMSQSILKTNNWHEGEIYYCDNFKKWLQMFVELVPCVNGNKEIIKSQPGFIKGIFEISYNLMKFKDKVYFNDTQNWIGKPDVLPISFKPQSRFWINYVKLTKKNNKIKSFGLKSEEGKVGQAKGPKLPPVTIVRKNGMTNLNSTSFEVRVSEKPKKAKEVVVLADEEISKKLQDVLINLTSFLRGHLKALCDQFDSYKRDNNRSNAIRKYGIKSKEVTSILKTYSENLMKRKLICQIYILCFLLVTKIVEIGLKEKRNFMVEIDDILGSEYWRSNPRVSDGIRVWYKGLFRDKSGKVKQ